MHLISLLAQSNSVDLAFGTIAAIGVGLLGWVGVTLVDVKSKVAAIEQSLKDLPCKMHTGCTTSDKK